MLGYCLIFYLFNKVLNYVLKTRIIPTLLYKDLGLVKGVGFDSWRRVGSAMQSIKVYNMREVDELVFLDITATQDSRQPDFHLIDDLADECFMPLAVGGGIKTIEDVRKLLMVGADKVVVNSQAVVTPDLISAIANQFGAQSIVVSIDARKTKSGDYEIYTHAGKTPTGLCPKDMSRCAQEAGAGEILITSIDNDGTMEGYDLTLIEEISRTVSIPVIASGGAGKKGDFSDALRCGASALAAASIFHFTEQTPLEIKHHLKDQRFPVRV